MTIRFRRPCTRNSVSLNITGSGCPFDLVEVITKYAKTRSLPRIPSLTARRGPDTPREVRTHAIRRRLSPEQINQLAADYRAGRSTTWLMRTYRLGKGTVLRLLEEQGVEMRGQGVPTDRIDEAIQLYVTDGLSLMKIARRMGCSAETVRQALLAAEVQVRARPGRPEQRVTAK